MDQLAFADALQRAGRIDRFSRLSPSGAVTVTYHGQPWDLVPGDGWLLAGTGGVREVALLENRSCEACAMVPPVVFALLDDGHVLCLDDRDEMAVLGQRLHRGLSPGGYAQALARTHSPAGRQDRYAEVIGDPDDPGEHFAGRNLPWLKAPRASRSGGRINLTFCARRHLWPVARIEQWRVTAPVDAPATWEAVTAAEAELTL